MLVSMARLPARSRGAWLQAADFFSYNPRLTRSGPDAVASPLPFTGQRGMSFRGKNYLVPVFGQWP